MAESYISVSVKKSPPNRNLTVYVNGVMLNRFESFNINHALDVVPMSFQLVYGYDDGEKDDSLSISNLVSSLKKSKKLDKTQVSNLLCVGQKIEIYLEGQHAFTGYIENATEAYSYGEHKLYIDGRSLVSTIVDSTTNKPSGQLPSAVTTLYDVANYMFGDFGITTKDKTSGETKYSMANLLQISLETKPYDYVSTLAQFEGKLLYDNELGQMVIDNVAKDKNANTGTTVNGLTYLGKDSDGIDEYDMTGTLKPFDCITNDNSQFEEIATHKSILGRYRNYTCVINMYGGPPGTDQIVTDRPSAQDYKPSELPPGKNLTIVSTAGYPTDGSVDGVLEFQKDLMQYTANVNWGRGQTITGTVTGFLNPITKKLWRVNTFVKFKMDKPAINGGYVVQALNFYIDSYGGRKTSLVLVPPEALQIQPVTIAQTIPMGHSANNTEDSSNEATTATQKPQTVQPPTNAKPNS